MFLALQIVRGIKKPSGLPLPINMAIDSILKNEFDHFRQNNTPHPEVEKTLSKAIRPYQGDNLLAGAKGQKLFMTQ